MVIFNRCLLMLLLWSPELIAKDLGSMGKTYPIAEHDLLVMIRDKLKILATGGSIARHQQQFQARVQQQVLRPQPVLLPRTNAVRRHRYDPSIVIDQDIVDQHNQVVVAAGTRANPLDLVSLPDPLLFFNGDDADQVCWVEQQIKAAERVKLILVQGDVAEMTSHFKQAIYFDQFGKLVTQLGISQVPAIVTQVDKHLLITESIPCLG